MRYVLWSGAASGISLPKWMENARHMIDCSRGWRTALTALPSPLKAKPGELIDHLEINCHGVPAGLKLPGGSPAGMVDYTSVDEFGAMLKPSLTANARIELLACSVASVTTGRFSAEDCEPCAYSDSVMTEYWGAYTEHSLLRGDSRNDGMQIVVVVTDQERIKNLMETIEARKKVRHPPEKDGLTFCLRLAARTGAIVRAADFQQVEEGGEGGDTFGNWEGHVWDFFPDGRVKYLGINLPRHQEPVAWAPGRLREGHGSGRPMHSLAAADSPLRQQRFNRAPLPA